MFLTHLLCLSYQPQRRAAVLLKPVLVKLLVAEMQQMSMHTVLILCHCSLQN